MISKAYTKWKIALMEPDKLWTKQEIYSLVNYIERQQGYADLAELNGNNLYTQFKKLIRYLEAEGMIGLSVDPAFRRELLKDKTIGPGFIYWVDIGKSGPVFKIIDPDKGYKVIVRPRKGPSKLLDEKVYGRLGSGLDLAHIEKTLNTLENSLKSLRDLIT